MHLKVFTKCQMLCNAYDDMSGFSILNTRGVTPGRAAVEAWVRKTTLCWSVADVWGPVAAVASGTGNRAGVGDVRLTRGAKWQRQLAGLLGTRASSGILGRLAGPRACALGLAGPRSRAAGWEAHFFFSLFSVFHFFSLV